MPVNHATIQPIYYTEGPDSLSIKPFMKKIMQKLLNEMENGNTTVLVTVTGSDGSTPRGTGAAMLVDRSGLIAGTIGGGAVEKESIGLAADLLTDASSGPEIIHHFRLHPNEAEDIGMICGGNMTVKLRRICPDDADMKEDAQKYLTDEQNAPRAVLFGGGHCSRALAPVLASVGFRIVVMDDRAEMVTAERYPMAEERIVGDFEHLDDYLTLGPGDYIVIMTSGHAFDYQVESQVLRKESAYVGAIGSKTKVAAINRRLLEDGIPQDVIDRVHSPIGLKIKAKTPEEIAVSIAAEIIYERAVRNEGTADS